VLSCSSSHTPFTLHVLALNALVIPSVCFSALQFDPFLCVLEDVKTLNGELPSPLPLVGVVLNGDKSVLKSVTCDYCFALF